MLLFTAFWAKDGAFNAPEKAHVLVWLLVIGFVWLLLGLIMVKPHWRKRVRAKILRCVIGMELNEDGSRTVTGEEADTSLEQRGRVARFGGFARLSGHLHRDSPSTRNNGEANYRAQI